MAEVQQFAEEVVLTFTVDYDLTGIGTLTVNFAQGNETWTGAGTTNVTAAGAGASTFTYTSDSIDFDTAGEMVAQACLRYADGRYYPCSFAEITVNPSIVVA